MADEHPEVLPAPGFAEELLRQFRELLCDGDHGTREVLVADTLEARVDD